MTLDRRELLGAFGGLAASRLLGARGSAVFDAASQVAADGTASLPSAGAPLPRREDFAIPDDVTYLNAAYTHPIPRVSMDAARRAAERRASALPVPAGTPTPRDLFAARGEGEAERDRLRLEHQCG